MSDSDKRLLIFDLQRARYALELQAVAEVMEPAETFPIPRAPRHFAGVMNVHGSPVAVLDLASFLGRGSAVPDGKILVLDRRLASLALWVDRVESIVSAEQVADAGGSEEELTARLLATADGVLMLLHLERLLERLEEGINEAAQ